MTSPSNSLPTTLEQWAVSYKTYSMDTLNTQLDLILNFIYTQLNSASTEQKTNVRQRALAFVIKLQQHEAPTDLICAGLLYTLKTEIPTLQDHAQPSGVTDTIRKLAQHLLKTDLIDDVARGSNNADNYDQNQNLRRMLLAIVENPRVIILKLVHCICKLHRLKSATEEKQVIFAQRVMNIYAPLANRLGLGKIKWELEDIAFRYLHKDEYFTISKSLKLKRSEREQSVGSMKHNLDKLLTLSGIKIFQLEGRVKHIYSIAKKMQRKQHDFSQIFDTTAMRILVPTTSDCYKALAAIHNQWKNYPEEFDDYINAPKPNGYQSIHTAIHVDDIGTVEIQLRTFQMHEESEQGFAAHWKYKEQPTKHDSYQNKIKLLRQVVSSNHKQDSTENTSVFQSLVKDRVYVFSPLNQVYDLTIDATPLDFAYRVHTEVGHRCRGAKVNGKLVSLKQKLVTGDKIEILTANSSRPSRDWLNLKSGYITTSQAISKVKQFFKKEQLQQNLKKGHEAWERAYHKHQLNKNSISSVVEEFNLTSTKDLLSALGANDVSIESVVHKLTRQKEPSLSVSSTHEANESKKARKQIPAHIYIDGITGIHNYIATCCNPIPGESIIGFITKDRGISIHKPECKSLQEHQKQHPEKIIPATWGDLQQCFQVHLTIECIDKKGLINEINDTIMQNKCKLVSLSSRSDHFNSSAIIQIEIQVDTVAQLEKTEREINQHKNVMSVIRQ